MGALFPWLLTLLPLAAAPVIFHLCYRLRRQSLPFSSLMFFMRVDPHAQARRRLRDIILLALRVIVLLLAILALARPQLQNLGTGGAAAIAVVIDTSASMGSPTIDNRTALAVAVSGAMSLIDVLQPGDTAALVPTLADPSWALPLGLVSDHALLHAGLDHMAVTAASADVPRALATAVAMLSESAVPRRELHVFSDLQAHEWSQPSMITPGMLASGIRVIVHRVAVPKRSQPDVAIRALQPPAQRVVVGRPARTQVVLANPSALAVTVAVRITEADGSERLVDATVPAGGEHTLSVVLTPRNAGACTATVRVTGDGFAGNNVAGIAVWAEPRVTAALVGTATDFALLPTALSPEGDGSRSGMVPRVMPPSAVVDLLRGDKKSQPAVIIITWEKMSALPAELLHEWVVAGGRLLVVPSPAVVPSGGQVGAATWAWLGGTIEPLHEVSTPAPLTVISNTAVAWNDLRGAAGAVEVSDAHARRWRPVRPATGAVVAYGLADGTPLLVEKHVGAGFVGLSGLAFHPAWSDLPLKGWSLALVHAWALPTAGDTQVLRLVAGQGFAASSSTQVVHLRTPGGPSIWQGARRDLPPLAFGGVYTLENQVVSIQAAPSEGLQNYLTAAPVAALGSGEQQVTTIDDPQAIGKDWRARGVGTDVTGWLAIAALLALAVEGWLATTSNVPRQANNKTLKPVAPSASVAVLWLPVAPAVVIAVVVIAVGVVLLQHYQRLRLRLDPAKARWHLAPRALISMLLIGLLLGPTLRYEQTAMLSGTVLALVDTSSSMDVVDDGKDSRLTRARNLIPLLQQAMPSGVSVRVLGFDTRVRGALPPTFDVAERPGDPAAVLRGLGAEPAARGALATVVLSDGGDEPFIISAPPPSPMSVIGIGTDAATWRNLAIAEVRAPATAEVRLATTITVDVTNQAPAPGPQATSTPVDLALLSEGVWTKVASETADIHAGRARVTFQRTHDTSGLQRYRVELPPLAGEIARSDNHREFAIDVREQTLHVLFFTRELGADYKALRRELARDAGLTFTGLLRTSVSATTGEQYLLQGDRLDGDAVLAGGFPKAAKDLARYGTIILGSFEASAWRPGEQQALVTWVAQGGTLIWLGGEHSFATGGYAATPLGGLLPCAGDDGLVRGVFPVSVPSTAQQAPAVAGVAALLSTTGSASVDSRNRLGALSPVATVLLTATDQGRAVPLLVSQPHGRGMVLIVATNTLWRLAKPGQESAFGTLWRQMVRQQAAGDRERLVRVVWDRERYRPGDSALVTLTALLPDMSLRAAVRRDAGALAPLALDDHGRTQVEFSERGEWRFQVFNGADEIYAKTLIVAPGIGEGNHLAVDEATLRAAAHVSGGAYARESEAAIVFARLATQFTGTRERHERGVLDGWWTVLVIVGLFLSEWLLRRQRNWL